MKIPPPLTPPHKGEGDSDIPALFINEFRRDAVPATPSPLWGGVRGGGILATAVMPGALP